MPYPTEERLRADLAAARTMAVEAMRVTSLAPLIPQLSATLGGGKMLRARLSIGIGGALNVPRNDYLRLACVVEMMHAASLLHDDVIDGAELRRNAPAFWKAKGISGAILLGDLLVCRSINLMCEAGDLSAIAEVVSLAGVMCDAEAYQELMLRGETPDWDACVRIARGKTGALFALAACGCAGDDDVLRDALREAGYAIGTAYQLADDLLDACGDSRKAGKRLGTDAMNGKVTAFSAGQREGIDPREHISRLCASAEANLAPWPRLQDAWRSYMKAEMTPRIAKFVESFSIEAVA